MTLSEEKRREAVERIEREINWIEKQLAEADDIKKARRLKRQLKGKQNIKRRLLGKFL